jgi:hypothetical protein
MKKIIKLKESDIETIVKKVLSEQGNMAGTAGTGMKAPFTDWKSYSDSRAQPVNKNINPKGLKLGDGGKKSSEKIEDVKKLQQSLMDLGYLVTDTMIPTGYFGSLTNNALKALYSGAPPTNKKKQTSGKEVVNKQSQKTPATSKAAKNAAKCETGTEKVLQPAASLVFDGDKLSWFADGKTIKSWDAVSGRTWKNTSPKEWGLMTKRYTTNREVWAKDENAGPLPEGKYSVGPLETRLGQPEEISGLEAFWYKLTGQVGDSDREFCKNTILSRISWGNYRLRITPTGGQDMYARHSFYLHGGSIRGSIGCIDLTDDMEDFAKFFGVWSSANKQKTMPLIVKYKNPLLNQVIQKLVNLSTGKI